MRVEAIHRVRQGILNLSAETRPEDQELARRYLTPCELELFERMEPADQRHSTAVLRSLLAEGIDDRALLKAALLHDVGKSCHRLSVVHRTIAVLLRAAFGRIPSFLVWQGEHGARTPFYVIENHPRLGASMLAQAGCEERVWRLAELHHAEPEVVGPVKDEAWVRWALAELMKADRKN